MWKQRTNCVWVVMCGLVMIMVYMRGYRCLTLDVWVTEIKEELGGREDGGREGRLTRAALVMWQATVSGRRA